MKKLMCVCCLLFGAALYVSAQDTTAMPQSDQYSQDQDKDWGDFEDKDMIAASELPAMVRQKLQAQDYSGWTVDKAFKKDRQGQVVYGVKLKKGDEKKKVLFDAQGNVMKEKDKDPE